jgi:hypothetical protein
MEQIERRETGSEAAQPGIVPSRLRRPSSFLDIKYPNLYNFFITCFAYHSAVRISHLPVERERRR